MDNRKYDAIQHVAGSHFDAAQRTRLEAFTAAKLLKPNIDVHDQLAVADYIVTGSL